MSLYEKSLLHHLSKLNELAPEQARAFGTFNAEVFKDGAVSNKDKEIIAVAAAHATKCPYCLDIHTKKAKAAGASLEELAEAAFVAAALEAGGTVSHSVHMQLALIEDSDDEIYKKSNTKKLANMNRLAKDGYQAYSAFGAAALKAGKLSALVKELAAVAVAHVTQCPYCIDFHSKAAQKAGATEEQLAEAILVGGALAAGGAYTHIANMIESYSEEK
ncbi:carboxymuconolactone decarboxylase family protein [Heyndrickxia acidiproducens]|uniref:carboxymuconolactone decarboxylase family protein n=1 Tax=Heyndrickxia acidiproducens TaxID=1121084 RepID=UPI000381992F|nr:carboxymuconolactone decarboxylase family protein [Heyndrickxia acidiproducens]